MTALLLLALSTGVPPIAIEHARVEVGDGTHLPRATVVLEGGRIVAVAPDAAAPANALRINGAGKVLTPGLIETRSTLGLMEVEMEQSTVDHTHAALSLTPALRAADAFNPGSVRIPIAREEGVTSAITHPRGGVLWGLGYWVALTGLPGSRPATSDPIALFGGVGSDAAARQGGTRSAVWLALRRAFDDALFYRRNQAAVQRRQAPDLSLPLVQLAALWPVLDGRLPWVVQAERQSDILTALEVARTYGLRLVISGGAEAWTVAQALATAKVPVLLRPSIQAPWSFEALAARQDSATVLHEAGVPVVLSAGDWSDNIGRLRQEAGMAVARGLPHAEALHAITQAPARIFGKDPELGTIAVGKRGDLVLWSGDPFELSTRVEWLAIAGEPQSLDTRQRALARRYLARPTR